MLMKEESSLYPKTYTYYIIAESKEDAKSLMNSKKRERFIISKIYYLGDSLTFGHRIFTNQKGQSR